MEEIDLKSLFQIALKWWWIIVSVTASAIVIAAVYSFLIVKPIYQSNTSVYVGKNMESQAGVVYNDLLLGDRLVSDYRELVKSRYILEQVIKELGLDGMTQEKLALKLSVNSKKDTRFIEISAIDPDPVIAQRIADKVAQVFQEKAIEIMKIENVQIIDSALVSKAPIKPNKKMNLAIAMVLGLMVGVGIVFLIEYFDDTIKTPEDIQKHLGIPVIGTIPVFPE